MSQLVFGLGEILFKIEFQDGGGGSHLGILIGMFLSIFYQQVALILPTKFRVNWHFGSGKNFKTACQDAVGIVAILDFRVFRLEQVKLFFIY